MAYTTRLHLHFSPFLLTTSHSRLFSMASTGSGPLTSAEIFSLKDGLVVIGCQYVFWGIYCALAVGTGYLLIVQGLHMRSRKVLLALICVMFVSSTSISVIRIVFQLKLIDVYGPVPYDPSELIIRLTSVSNCLERLNYVLSDTIVVWRAWLFYQRNRKIKIALVTVMACSAVAAIIDGAFTVVEEVNANGLALPTGADTLILTLPLLITNIFATSLIAYQAWLYRKEVQHHFSDGTVSTSVGKLLMILVESGFVYCGLWILVLITRYRLLSNLAFDVMFAVFPHLTAIYPVLIIMLATLHRTQMDKITTRTPINTMSFGKAPPHYTSTTTATTMNTTGRSGIKSVLSSDENHGSRIGSTTTTTTTTNNTTPGIITGLQVNRVTFGDVDSPLSEEGVMEMGDVSFKEVEMV
ncbi:hypothetical protein D9757_005030 [Collybiopsis confluens]|uniref:Uncharacterized protein n=1 Tax=Collybiopsis confluens TaxID=2823264 RepID=A0A8H5HTF5_9AGAR|nr:hypothetical protein D9757_005030 [Collybiopsis confluens]